MVETQIFHHAKNIIFKTNPLKINQNPSRYYYYNSIITNPKFQHKPKIRPIKLNLGGGTSSHLFYRRGELSKYPWFMTSQWMDGWMDGWITVTATVTPHHQGTIHSKPVMTQQFWLSYGWMDGAHTGGCLLGHVTGFWTALSSDVSLSHWSRGGGHYNT